MIRPSRAILVLVVSIAACSSTGGDNEADARDRAKRSHDPLYALTLMRQGSVMLQQGRYEDALEQFEAADRIAPGNATVHNMLGLCHLKLENHDRALAEFNEALDLTPTFTDARNNRGSVYLAIGEYRMAEVDYVGVLADSTYPHRSKVNYNLGIVHLKQGRLAAAEESFRRVVTSAEPVFDAYLRLAEIAQMRDQPEVAIDLLEEARIKFPERLEAAVELGRLLLSVGRTDEGRLQLKEVVAKAPNTENAARARSMLSD